MRKYQACVVGYYGMKNTGDDALLAASLYGAKHLMGLDGFSVTSSEKIHLTEHGEFPALLAKQQAFKGQKRLQHYYAACRSEHIIFGGGSVFHTAQDISIKRHMMKLANKKSYAMGVGLGPFKNTAAEKQCQKFLQECHFIGVRDEQSWDIAQSLAPDSNCVLTFDLAPLLLEQVQLDTKRKRKGIAVCLCPNERLKGDFYKEKIRLRALAYGLVRAFQETQETIYLLDFNGHECLGDGQVHRELQQLLIALEPSIKVEHLSYQANPYAVLKRMSEFKMVLAMRLHAAILGFLADTPVLSLNYHNKCQGWCDQVGINPDLRFDCNEIDPQRLASTLLYVMESSKTKIMQSLGYSDKKFQAQKLDKSQALFNAKQNWVLAQ